MPNLRVFTCVGSESGHGHADLLIHLEHFFLKTTEFILLSFNCTEDLNEGFTAWVEFLRPKHTEPSLTAS